MTGMVPRTGNVMKVLGGAQGGERLMSGARSSGGHQGGLMDIQFHCLPGSARPH